VIRLASRIARIDGFALRMASFYAAFFAFGGIQMPYLPAWLAAKGLDDREIGIMLAAPMAIRIVALPLAARLIDRRFDHKTALTVMAAAGAAGYAAMGMVSGFVAILAVYAAISIVQSPLLPVGDSYGLRGLSARGLVYGRVRLWGSVAFILANMGGGIFLAALGAGPLIVVLAAAMAATAAAAWMLPAAADGAALAPKRRGDLWRSGQFVTVVAGASLVQASHAVMYGFATLQWSAAGLDGAAIGVLWAIGVVAEILLFAVSGSLMTRFGATAMIMAGALGAVLRWTAMAFHPPGALLPALQCLHALSFGATHVGAMQVLSRLADRGSGATAQGDFSALQGVTFAAAMGLSGVLVERFGDRAYWAMALVAAAGLFVTAAGRRWRVEANAP
jgi:MFS transporter, PPP family, 3-phenylpropionic acid transporter